MMALMRYVSVCCWRYHFGLCLRVLCQEFRPWAQFVTFSEDFQITENADVAIKNTVTP